MPTFRPLSRFLLAACLLAIAACAHAPADLAIVGATVIDPATGTRTADQTVLVEAGRIRAVGDTHAVRVAPGTPTVHASGRFLIPGLWDMHTHTLWDPVVRDTSLPLFVAHGVTGVRDMGGTLDVLAQVRREQRDGVRPWPRIVAAGPVLDGPQPVDPSVSLAVADAGEARSAVAVLDAAGVDFIKVYTMLPPEAYRAVVEAARARGLPVAGHIPYGVDARDAAMDMRSIEHLRAETGGLCAELSATDCAEIHAALRDQGVWQVPTLVARRPRAFVDDPTYASDPRLATVPAVLRDMWLANRAKRLARSSPADFAKRKVEFAGEMRAAGALPGLGIPLMAGSDAGSDFAYAGSGLHDELALLVEAGLTPLQALQAATIEPARYLERDDLGRIGPGAVADLVLLAADPLEDIRNSATVDGVVLDGRWLDRAALDGLIEGARHASE